MTEADKRRKVAKQFERRVRIQLEKASKGRMRFALGTHEYWAVYNKRLEEQEGVCAICERSEPGGRGRWHLDHDRKTGQVRGLLCCDCNLKLGWFEANLSGVVKYLRKWSKS